MAVSKMQLVTVSGDISRLDKAIEACCSGGDFHIEQATDFFDSRQGYSAITDENPYNDYIVKLNDALAKAKLEVAQCDSASSKLESTELTDFVDKFADDFDGLSERKNQLEEEIRQTDASIEQVRHFTGLGINLSELFALEFVHVRFGRLPRESYEKLGYYSDNPYVMCFPSSEDKKYVWGFYCAPVDSIGEVDRIFQSLYWERLWVPTDTGTPEEACAKLESRKRELEAELKDVSTRFDALWAQNKDRCSLVSSLLETKKQNFDLRRNAVRYGDTDTFYLAGWVPLSGKKRLESALGDIKGITAKFEKPEETESEPPVKLKNRMPFKAFEFFVSMYGLPTYKEVDPTPFVAITYFLLFGIMFGDVGQGLVLMLVAYIYMWKIKKMPLGRAIAVCGFSSMFFGLVFGSVFGFEEWLNPLYAWLHEKTGVPLTNGKLIDLNHSSTILTLIYAAVGLGVAMVCIAIMINIYSKLKQKMWGEALFSANGLAGLVFYASLIIGLGGQLILGLKIMTTPYIIFLIALPLLLIFLCEPLSELLAGKEHWLPESPSDFIMQSIFELIEVLLSYVSNTVSFMRVSAFILVHAGMMQVVFTLAGDTVNAKYIIIVIIGNIIIMCLEALLVGIQALRLEFYEMFSRFFSGSGREYNPVSLTAKTENK